MAFAAAVSLLPRRTCSVLRLLPPRRSSAAAAPSPSRQPSASSMSPRSPPAKAVAREPLELCCCTSAHPCRSSASPSCFPSIPPPPCSGEQRLDPEQHQRLHPHRARGQAPRAGGLLLPEPSRRAVAVRTSSRPQCPSLPRTSPRVQAVLSPLLHLQPPVLLLFGPARTSPRTVRGRIVARIFAKYLYVRTRQVHDSDAPSLTMNGQDQVYDYAQRCN
ncbi:hypothetical protein CFC21_035327 [Triticum aestivum]|nr:hypothetical protein CFC21_035327 [Triticum aestivum]